MRALTIALIICAGLGAAYVAGLAHGKARVGADLAASLAKAQTATIRAAERASRIEAARITAEAERDALAQAMEDAAHADPSDACGLSAGRVDRLRQP